MKKKQKVLNKILKKLNLGQIKEITEDTSSLYKVVTDNKTLIVKHYNKEIITKNENKLQELIDCSNSNIDLIKEDLCINPNNYNIENILWENDYMYLINFDKVFMSNPIVSLAQLAYDISTNDNIFNIDYYNEFITTYLKKYGDIELDFGIALISSMNPKLQDLETLLESNNYEESIKVLEDILLFLNNKDNMLNSFNDYIKEATEKKNKKKQKNKKKKKI